MISLGKPTRALDTLYEVIKSKKRNHTYSEKLIERFGVTVDGAIVEEDKLDHRNMGYLFNKQGMLMQQYQLVPGISERLIREITELDKIEFETS